MTARRLTFLLAALLAALLARPARACIWDSDTLYAETRGLPGVLSILTGRFDRLPPLYYEMRLARASAAIAAAGAGAADLALYDDAGAACDRLARDDESLLWMERKAAALDALGDGAPKDHRYRLLANRGTFRAHRWLRGGADRAKIGEMAAARDDIAAAIRIEPNAHFGRERYQLLVMEWIVDPTIRAGRDTDLHADFAGFHAHGAQPRAEDGLARAGMPDAIAGIAGLVVLGSAWESVDVTHALRNALLVDGRSSVARVAELRLRELIDSGKGSLAPGAKTGAALNKALVSDRESMYVQYPEPIDAWYAEARADADAWLAARHEFVLSRLREGRHPDTDPAFWTGIEDVAPGAPPEAPIEAWETTIEGLAMPGESRVAWIVASAGAAAVLLVVLVLRRRARTA